MALLVKLDGLWEAKAALSIGVLGHQGLTLFYQLFRRLADISGLLLLLGYRMYFTLYGYSIV